MGSTFRKINILIFSLLAVTVGGMVCIALWHLDTDMTLVLKKSASNHAAILAEQVRMDLKKSLKPEEMNSLFNQSNDVMSHLIGPNGTILASSNNSRQHPIFLGPDVLQNRSPASQFEFDVGQNSYVGAYNRVGSSDMGVLSQIPSTDVSSAKQHLITGSLIASFVFLLMAAFITYYIHKRVAEPVINLAEASKILSNCNFGYRVLPKRNAHSKDEIYLLTQAFNSMAEKVESHLKDTQEKTRMEGELVTAHLLQRRFFPKEPLHDDRFEITGKLMTATECCGDWWNYAKIENFLIVVMGDVTGHGVSAALVTGAAHTAYSMMIKENQSELLKMLRSDLKYWMNYFLQEMNRAIIYASDRETTMTLVVTVIDLQTGRAHSLNAANRPPYIIPISKATDESLLKLIQPLAIPTHDPLGSKSHLHTAEPHSVTLGRGDLLLWYTDGLFETTDPNGARVNRRAFFQKLLSHAKNPRTSTQYICDKTLSEVHDFLTQRGQKPLDDDITVALGRFAA
jgi:serine phosphatase RsbU (regulator of sigma subunit)